MNLIQRIIRILKLVITLLVSALRGIIAQLPLYNRGLRNIPAVPLKPRLIRTLRALGKRNSQTRQAVQGLNTLQTIGGVSRPAHAFLWGDIEVETDETEENRGEAEHAGDRSAQARHELRKRLNYVSLAKALDDSMHKEEAIPVAQPEAIATLNRLSLEDPRQFSMAWTTFPDVYGESEHLLDDFSATLTDVNVASRTFWTTISEYGMPYNLLFIEKVGAERATELAGIFGTAWDQKIQELHADALVYVIDLRIFETCAPQQASSGERFSPASITVLSQDAETKALEPILIRVSGEGGKGAQIYRRGEATTDSAWLYALQAAKASIGVYGIWLGHVYYWHLPTAAVQMTMYNCLPEQHPLYRLLCQQSKYLIEFDTVLLLLWKQIAPPTSITSAQQFLKLEDTFAEGRTFFDDDPTVTLEKLGISREDFSSAENKPWDQYRFVARLLKIWEITGEYVKSTVEALYKDDGMVAADDKLQEWMRESSKPEGGNIRGLPTTMNTREELRRFLQSYLYRIVAHGSARLPNSANPGLTFVPNFPPCLQRSDIPRPDAEISTRDLLTYLPNTGTIGEYLSFFYIFSFSVPYATVIPTDGVEEELFFEGNTPEGEACNEALIRFRKAIIDFIGEYQEGTPQVTQWARNIET